MRWPNRHPHVLTPGMRVAQKSLHNFLGLIDWIKFKRINLNQEIQVSSPAFAGFACGDAQQAIVWLLRKDKKEKNGLVSRLAEPVTLTVTIPGLADGHYQVTCFDTLMGEIIQTNEDEKRDSANLMVSVPPIITDIALAIKKI